MNITIGKFTLTAQTIFKMGCPIFLIATLLLLLSSILSEKTLFSGVNLVAIGSTCLSYYFAKRM